MTTGPTRTRLAFAGLMSVLAFLLTPISPAIAAETVVTDLRVGIHEDRTRIVLELTKPVEARMFRLANPYRLVVDIPETGWRLPARPLPGPTGVYRATRYGLYQPGQSRIVFETSTPTAVLQTFYIGANGDAPHRLVIDLARESEAAFHAALDRTIVVAANTRRTVQSGAVAPEPASVAVAPSAAGAENPLPAGPRKPYAPSPPRKRIIAIDAGHGGADPGAIGRSGIYEKHITLAFAREMARVFEASGRYDVRLVRDRDVFIALRDRVARARKSGADLFISLHADTIKNRNTRGLSVYTLSETASDKEAAVLAEKENKADIVAGMDFNNEPPEVANILIDLAQRESMNESARYANTLIMKARPVTKVLRKTHRFAGFAVLKAPDVPSVLVELGFLSNPTDEKNLQSRAYRRKFAKAALGSLDEYFASVQQANTY